MTDEDGDGRGERVREVASGLRMPSGVAFDDGTGVRLATAFGVSEPTVRTWIPRFRAEGRQGLQNRSSRPHNLCRQTPAPVVQQIAAELGVSAEVERRFLDHAVQHPRYGSFRLVEELAVHGIQIPSSGARGV